MRNKTFKVILASFISIIMVCSIFTACSNSKQENVETTTAVEQTTEEVTVSDEVVSMAEDTKEAVKENKDIATNEIIEGSEDEEATVVDEGAIEPDAQVEQENIAWEGSNSGSGLSLLGACKGLTYYNQADSRWANKLYTSTGDRSQTMASSACGPTAAAMVVSSSKGAILPTTMAQLFVDNGYRTANNGTAWACWPFVADYFDFDKYYTTTSDSKMLSYLKTDKNKDGVSDYFVVASCNSGLWTTGGHYIVLVADNNGTITVYDPYLYAGKYNTASRRAANVKVSGNSAYVTESNFKKYSNTQKYWIFSNDYTGKSSSTSSSSSSTKVNYTRYVSTSSANLNVRSSANISSSIKTSLKKGTKVKVTKVSGSWSYITSPTTGWVSIQYLSSSPVSTSGSSTSPSKVYSTSVGKTYKLKSATTLYSKGNLTGTKYQYLKNTTIKVISHYSTSVDYIYVVQTGRYAYCKISAFNSSTSSSSSKSTIGQVKTLKSATTLYSKSNLSGTKYQYKANTTVTVIKNISSSVDYVKVRVTGRYAYVRTSAYK